MYPFFLLNTLPNAPMFTLDPQVVTQMLLVLLNVIILAIVLSKLLYKPVRQILHDRRARILEEIQNAEKDKEEAAALKQEYERIMKSVAQEKQEILDTARKEAAERTKEQLSEAKNEAEAVKARALKEIQLEQERAQSEMKQEIINVSSAMAGKFLARAIDADVHEQLFEETMAELEEIAWHN